MLSFRPFGFQYPSMNDFYWVAMPRSRRAFPMFDDFMDLDREIDNMMGHMQYPQATATKAEQSGTTEPDNKDAAKKTWTEMHSSFSSAREGPRFVSRRTVRVRDDTGRDETIEERCLDGRVSKKTTKLGSGTPQQAIEGDATQQQQEQKGLAQAADGAMDDAEFDKLWEQNPLAQWVTNTGNHDRKRKDAARVPLQQQVNKSQPEPQPEQPQQPSADAAMQDESAPAPDVSSTARPDFSAQLQQIAQLGLPCDSAAYQLLQHTGGSVERTVLGLLSLQRMKELGMQDETRCVTALCKADLNLDKACELMRQEM